MLKRAYLYVFNLNKCESIMTRVKFVLINSKVLIV